ncbi:MAG: alpha/beta fold hydrolase [Jaaginema sp. PMC 1079.18]|nr:alpha/beta fold hydrolase [Jaaginema sp. PMC 1080.18]MEC4849382.1 alpha/beta fold hydrolase [Jaaginema sp. PMC 1079.18]MEC4865415.1 alpha/beta fold hydrolase [Jaaginema sp. PMC 1078.18]
MQTNVEQIAKTVGSVNEQSIIIGELEWFYREAQPETTTDKPPILFLHGLPSQSLSWCEIMTQVADRGWRAIAPDWIGHGFSSKPERRDFDYTPDTYIKALEDFVNTLELGTFHLVVQGFLGSVGLQYGIRHPEKIERLVILNTPLSPTAKLPWKMKQWGIPLVGDMLTQDPLLVDRTLEGGSGFQIGDRNLDIYRKPFLQTSASGRSLLATIKQLNLANSTAEIATGLQNWTKPVQIFWGCADPWLEIDTAQTLANSQSNIELTPLPEARHYPQEHWSEEIGPDLINFLRRQLG